MSSRSCCSIVMVYFVTPAFIVRSTCGSAIHLSQCHQLAIYFPLRYLFFVHPFFSVVSSAFELNKLILYLNEHTCICSCTVTQLFLCCMKAEEVSLNTRKCSKIIGLLDDLSELTFSSSSGKGRG